MKKKNVNLIFNIEIPIYYNLKKKNLSKILIRSFLPYQQKIFKKVFFEFYFRKNYLESQPSNGELNNKSSLILEIFFEKNTNLLNHFNLKYIINNTIIFKRFIDFQYLSNQNFLFMENMILNLNKTYELHFRLENKGKNQNVPLDIIPTFFSRYIEKKNKQNNVLLNYENFFTFKKKIINENFSFPVVKLDKRSSIGDTNKKNCFFDFLYDNIPNLPNSKVKKKLFEIPLFAIGYICIFLKRRPIWTRRILEFNIPFSIKKFIKKILPVCSYRFKNNNPYKRTWIRYGYDPRKKSKSLIYQTFNIKKLNQDNIRKGLVKNNIFKKNFKTKRFYEQICDFDDNLFKHLIKSKKNLYINSVTGWLNFLDYINIKKKLKKIYLKKN
nr:transcription factor subunit [Cryptomonas curvata]